MTELTDNEIRCYGFTKAETEQIHNAIAEIFQRKIDALIGTEDEVFLVNVADL